MNKSICNISKMDCPSEEQLIRMKLASDNSISHIDFDIPNRTIKVFHNSKVNNILNLLEKLKLGSELMSTEETDEIILSEDNSQKKALIAVLLINVFFFGLEMLTGIVYKSMGLTADSLDMLADSFVYVLSLMAVGASLSFKNKIAKSSGFLQLFFAVIGLVEVIRRFFWTGQDPNFFVMMTISFLALLGNWACLLILQKTKNDESHMKASMIFTSNDIIINIGVILAGALVFLTSSRFPDLVIGTIVFLIVIQGAFRIFKISKT